MNKILEMIPQWAKIAGGIATLGGLIVGGVSWALAVDKAKDEVPVIKERVQKGEQDRALLECQIRKIPPLDCEMPEGD